MATSSKKPGAAGKRSRNPALDGTNLSEYVRFRTILDSLETGAIRFYLSAPNEAEKKRRFEKLRNELMPIINQVWSHGDKLIDCPRGYTDCDGVCVSYPCPQ